jgi:transposase-like protein
VNTSNDRYTARRRRRTHSAEFKAKVVAACRKPGVSMAAVALAHGLNANLLRRWVVADEQAAGAKPIDTAIASPAPLTVENRTFIPIQMERSAVTTPQEIAIELRRGATIVKVGWPLLAAADCAAWLRELLR